jgi:hypothetical protein
MKIAQWNTLKSTKTKGIAEVGLRETIIDGMILIKAHYM